MILKDSFLQELQQLRHELHQHPEVSGEEQHTAERITSFIKNYDPDEVIDHIGGYGLAFVFNGSAAGPTLTFRAELDALPIHEINEVPHRSLYENKGHKCGHDGHMIMVAALAKLLHDNRPAKGRVILLFQPAEETGQGARWMLNDPKYNLIEPDFIFALHNLPGYPENQIILKEGTFAAASKGLIIELIGKTSHAAEPQNGNSPLRAMSELQLFLNELTLHTENLQNFCLATVVHSRLGERAFGTTPGKAEVMTTIRAYEDSDLAKMEATAVAFANELGKMYGLKVNISDTESFSSTLNDKKAVDMITEASVLVSNDMVTKEEPFRWSEDFGLFTQSCKGALFGLGAGVNTPDLHNPDYDFPDEITATGVAVFYNIINNLLNKADA
ncbi:amidohydrolase [Fulvivirga sediminis]|uniref:Amidohydrolase n=1 Tax=Fulvivirga sediminis TaxID=2803949 RepID=A0A937F6W9_9BACT|nr:amidohydrolase [Fulvivirga sediminis]MBL3655739.1 amidohydrolase [Fulvivirga sediminis]